MAAKKIIVIGGGAVGLCAAHYLCAAGCDVTVLEMDSIGSGSSLHNAGLVVPSHFTPLASPGVLTLGLRWMLNPESPFYIKPRLDGELASWLWHFLVAATERRVERAMPLLRDMSQLSFSLFEELARLPEMDFEFQKRGLLMLWRTAHGRASTVKTAEQAGRIGIDARVLDRDGLHELEPGVRFNASGGVYYPGDAHLTPALFLEQLRELLARQKVQFFTSTRVTGFNTRPAAISSVRTTSGTFSADEYVLASGAWSPGVLKSLRIALPLEPGKGYSATIYQPAVRVRIPCLLEEDRVAVTPMGDRLRFAGTMELAGLDTSINLRRVNAILRAVPRYIAALEPAAAEYAEVWAGLRPCTPDGLPFIGRFQRWENLIAATGHAMIGISLAPITGKLVTEIVHGQIPSIDLHLLRPDRYS
ncbi:MAG TPA: FAD-dependent oxidoreductase [Bacteroidota bacterium]|nr:FAD-dependent oxidoreductase [Bacteroidota bacterium]